MSALQQRRLEALEQRAGVSKAVPEASKRRDKTLYEPLPQEVLRGPVATALQLRPGVERPREYVERLVHKLMETSSKVFDARKAFDTKLKHKVLLLENPVKLSTTLGIARGRALKRKIQHIGTLSATKRRDTGLYSIEQKPLKYEDFLAFQEMWREYVRKLKMAGVDPSKDMSKVEAIGARLVVIECNNPMYVGREGIVMHVTRKTFVLLGRDGKMSRVPRGKTKVSVSFGEEDTAWDAEEFFKGTTIA